MSDPHATHPRPQTEPQARRPGFSIVELTATIAILALLLGAGGVMAYRGTGTSHRIAAHRLAALVDQARNKALVSRSTVMLAIAAPGKLEEHPGQCVLGLLEVDGGWNEQDSAPVSAKLLGKWQPLDSGMVFLGGEASGWANPLDHAPRRVRYTSGRTVEVDVHGLVFNHRGRMIHPAGDAAAALRLAEGGYPGGVATPTRRGADQRVTDTWLQIGRAAGRVFEVRP